MAKKSGVEHLAAHPGWRTRKQKVVKSRSNVATVKLSADDWFEIYCALLYKLVSPALKGDDREAQQWRAHLRRITKAIGPDGKLAAASEYFDESELATVLAALRLFQKTYEGSGAVEIADSWPMHFNVQGDPVVSVEPEPLGTDDIETLCERLNCE